MRKEIVLFSLLLGVIMIGPTVAMAKNLEYNGQELILDQPEGDVRYFKVKYTVFEPDYWREKQNYYEEEFVEPFIFGNDGKVYVRNLLGDISCKYGSMPLWMPLSKDENGLYMAAEQACRIYFPLTGTNEDYRPINPINSYNFGKAITDKENPSIESIEPIGKMQFMGNKEGFSSNFVKDEGIKLNSQQLVIKIECIPSDFKCVVPPAGYKEEDYQINFIPYSEYFPMHSYVKGKASLRLKVIRTSQEIYIKGLSKVIPGNPEVWIKGKIQGKKVVFDNSQVIGIGRNNEIMYLTSLKSSVDREDITREGSRYTLITESIPETLTFDYDETSGSLRNPSNDFGLTNSKEIYRKDSYTWADPYIDFFWVVDYFQDSEIIKVPENYQYRPLSPKIDNRGKWTLDYLDINGYMMDPDRIFVQVYDSDNQPMYQLYIDYETWCQGYTLDFPFGTLYLEYLTGRVDNTYILSNNMKSMYGVWKDPSQKDDYISTYKANLVYMGDGYVAQSNPELSGVEQIMEDDSTRQSAIYDLTGRKIKKENLSPGIYIINGKKVRITR